MTLVIKPAASKYVSLCAIETVKIGITDLSHQPPTLRVTHLHLAGEQSTYARPQEAGNLAEGDVLESTSDWVYTTSSMFAIRLSVSGPESTKGLQQLRRCGSFSLLAMLPENFVAEPQGHEGLSLNSRRLGSSVLLSPFD